LRRGERKGGKQQARTESSRFRNITHEAKV
jgi:hypothetical protein